MASARLGPIKMAGMAAGAILALLVALYAMSVFFWAWILMLILGIFHVDWSYAQCLVPGLFMPLLLG